MMSGTDAATKRVSVDFTLPAYEKLAELKEETGATTISSVIRDALRVYLWAVEERKQGYKVGAIRETKDEIRVREITLPIDF